MICGKGSAKTPSLAAGHLSSLLLAGRVYPLGTPFRYTTLKVLSSAKTIFKFLFSLRPVASVARGLVGTVLKYCGVLEDSI